MVFALWIGGLIAGLLLFERLMYRFWSWFFRKVEELD